MSDLLAGQSAPPPDAAGTLPRVSPQPTPPTAVTVTLNGEPRRLPCGSEGPPTVSALLRDLGLEGQRVAVERNGHVVPRGEHEATTLEEGDVLEVVSFVGGG